MVNVLAILIRTQLRPRTIFILATASFVVHYVGKRVPINFSAIPSFQILPISLWLGIRGAFSRIGKLGCKMSDIFVQIRERHPRMFVSSSILILSGIFVSFIRSMKDPLHLKYAKGVSLQARKVSQRVSGIDNPRAFLNWREGKVGLP
jgi:hypothetical protein